MTDYYAGIAMCVLSLAWLAAHYLPEWNARLEERRATADAAAFRAQLAAMTDDERRVLAEDEAMALGNDEPIYAATWAYVFSHQLEDPAAIDRFLGRGA